MVSTSKHAVAEPPVSDAAAAATARPVAHLNARISAYLVDTVILFAFVLVFFVAGGAVLLFTSDLGRGDPPDAAYYGSVAVFTAGMLIGWSGFNLALLRLRGQTTGMYVLGIRVESEDRRPITLRQSLVWWFGLHPLLFHPLLVPVWGIGALIVFTQISNRLTLAGTVALLILCVVAPLAGLVSMLIDRARRALHERLARTVVVHLTDGQ